MNQFSTQTIYTDKRAFMMLASLCVSLFILYVYFVSASVVQVVMRTEVSQDITLISSEISALESKYIEAQHRVSSDIASLQGYQKITDKVFIDRSEDSLVLGNNASPE